MPIARPTKPLKRGAKAQPARSRGQIIQKAERKWLVRFFIERDPRTGKRRYGSATVTGSRRDAERELTKQRAAVAAGSYRSPSRLTLEGYLAEWLEERAADVRGGVLSPRSLEDYRRAAAKLVVLYGAMPLDAIGKRDVADLRRQLTEKYRAAAAQRAFDVFRMAMKRAFSLDIIVVNPAPAERRIKTPPPKTAVLDREQMARLLDEARHYRYGRYSALFHVLLFAGLRPSEALALQWAGLQGCQLHVRRSITEDEDGRRIIGSTKTRAERVVTLPQGVAEVLSHHRQWQRAGMLRGGSRGAWEDAGRLMFPDQRGGILRIECVRTAWNTIVRKAKLPKVRLYDARHSYVSTLLHLGVDARTVADQAGHKDPAMTLRRYAHSTEASKQAAADRLGDAFATTLRERRTA